MITIYGKDNCTYCDQAVNLCKQKGVEFTYKKLGVDITREELIDKIDSYGYLARTMPQIVDETGCCYIGGFAELKAKLM